LLIIRDSWTVQDSALFAPDPISLMIWIWPVQSEDLDIIGDISAMM